MYLTFWVKSAVQRVIKQKILHTITKACIVMLDVFGIKLFFYLPDVLSKSTWLSYLR